MLGGMTDSKPAVGLIARADNRGLGQQTWAFYRNVQPDRTLVLDVPSVQPLDQHFGRFPGERVIKGFPSRRDMDGFLDGLDVVYTAETGYGQHLWDAAETRGVSTVLHVNYEFWNQEDRPTVFALPTAWHREDLPDGAVMLPVPIEGDRLRPRTDPPRTASRFLHIVGRPAIHDRNGTPDLLDSLQHVTAPVTVVIACQQRGYVESLQRNYRIPSHVTVEVRSADVSNYWENYVDADALLMPRRFGGLCLPAQEAIGCGLPVLMPDVDPNNTWLPKVWLAPALRSFTFQAKQPVDVFSVDTVQYAALIDRLAQDDVFYGYSVWKAESLRAALLWDTLLPKYREVLR